MAEIQVERTKKRSATGWVIMLIVLVAVLGAGWYFMMGPGAATGPDMSSPEPAAATPPAP